MHKKRYSMKTIRKNDEYAVFDNQDKKTVRRYTGGEAKKNAQIMRDRFNAEEQANEGT